MPPARTFTVAPPWPCCKRFALQRRPGKLHGQYIERIAGAIAALLAREGLDYLQTKAVFKAARQKAGLTAPKPDGAARPPGSASRRSCASSTRPTPRAGGSG